MRRLFAAAVLLSALPACYIDSAPPDYVGIIGRLIEIRNDEEAFFLDGSSVYATDREGTILERQDLEEGGLVATTTHSQGLFQLVGMEKEMPVSLVFAQEGFAPTVFVGETARRDAFLFTGSVYQEPVERVQAFVDEYSAAVLGSGSLMTVGSAGNGAIVRGRVTRLVDPDTLTFQHVGGATVSVADGEGNSLPVYYRDAQGNVDPGAIATNESNATFAAFAVLATGAHPVFDRTIGRFTVTVTLSGRSVSEESIVLDGGVAEFDFFAAP